MKMLKLLQLLIYLHLRLGRLLGDRKENKDWKSWRKKSKDLDCPSKTIGGILNSENTVPFLTEVSDLDLKDLL